MSLSPGFAAALVLMQGKLKGAEKNAQNTFFQKKLADGKSVATPYSDLASCWDACKEALQDSQIALLQPIVDAPEGYVGIRTILVYGPTGETLEHTFAVPLKDAHNPQAMGSAITYGRRYSLCSVLGISPAEDDGNAAAGNGAKANNKPKDVVTKPPVDPAKVRAKFDAAKTDEEKKAVYQAATTANIPEPSKSQLLKQLANLLPRSGDSKE